MKVISFSLWGDKEKYTTGMIQNIKLASMWYSDWVCWVYCDIDTVPAEIVETIDSFPNAKAIRMSAKNEPHWTMFWRFYAASAHGVDIAVFRDADSRLTQRESLAVQEWVSSGKGFHAMRDHPQHGTPMCGGMWGVVGGRIPDMKVLIDSYYSSGLTKKSLFGIDQDFLTHTIWPMAHRDVCEHDEFFAKKPFPLPRDPKHFVGQVYDEKNEPQF